MARREARVERVEGDVGGEVEVDKRLGRVQGPGEQDAEEGEVPAGEGAGAVEGELGVVCGWWWRGEGDLEGGFHFGGISLWWFGLGMGLLSGDGDWGVLLEVWG